MSVNIQHCKNCDGVAVDNEVCFECALKQSTVSNPYLRQILTQTILDCEALIDNLDGNLGKIYPLANNGTCKGCYEWNQLEKNLCRRCTRKQDIQQKISKKSTEECVDQLVNIVIALKNINLQ